MDRQDQRAGAGDLAEKLAARLRGLLRVPSKIVDQSGSRHCSAWCIRSPVTDRVLAAASGC